MLLFLDYEEAMSLNILPFIPHWIAWRLMKFFEAVFHSSQFHSHLGLIIIFPLIILFRTVYLVTMDYLTSISNDLVKILMCTFQSS